MDLKKIILLGGVGLASGVVGVLLPTMMSGGSTPAPAAVKPTGHDSSSGHEKEKSGHDTKPEAPKADDHAADHGGGGHGGGGHGDGKDAMRKVERVGPQFLPFNRLVVNLNEPMLVKYLSVDISVQTDGKDYDEVEEALKARKPILNTWLTSHLADKTMEDVRGKVGVNRLRREIQDNFNSLLFKDGHERIQDIMFEEYHVQ